MNKKTLELIKDLKSVNSGFIYAQTCNEHFITGSFAFNMMTENSDIDVVILKDNVQEHVKYLVENGGVVSSGEYQGNNNRQSVYIKTDQNIYNFIVCDKFEFNVWKVVNNMFFNLIQNPEYRDILKRKEKRAIIFEQL